MRELQLSLLLQAGEAVLLLLGQSRCFPNVGKHRALSLHARPLRGRAFSIEISFFYVFAEVILRPSLPEDDIHIILHILNRDLPPALPP